MGAGVLVEEVAVDAVAIVAVAIVVPVAEQLEDFGGAPMAGDILRKVSGLC